MPEKGETKRKRRWFFSIVTEADALNATDNAAKAIYLFATLFLVLFLFPFVLLSREHIWSENSLGHVSMLFFIFVGCSIHLKQSRTAAIAFINWALLPISNIDSLLPAVSTLKGSDIIILCIILFPNIFLYFYASYYALLGSFKYQEIKKSRIIWKNTLALVGISIIFYVVAISSYLSITFFLRIESSTFVFGVIPVMLFILVVWLVSWRLLPGTRRLDVIARKRRLGFYRNYY